MKATSPLNFTCVITSHNVEFKWDPQRADDHKRGAYAGTMTAGMKSNSKIKIPRLSDGKQVVLRGNIWSLVSGFSSAEGIECQKRHQRAIHQFSLLPRTRPQFSLPSLLSLLSQFRVAPGRLARASRWTKRPPFPKNSMRNTGRSVLFFDFPIFSDPFDAKLRLVRQKPKRRFEFPVPVRWFRESVDWERGNERIRRYGSLFLIATWSC